MRSVQLFNCVQLFAAGLSDVADAEDLGHIEHNQSRQTHTICPWGFWGGNCDSDFKRVGITFLFSPKAIGVMLRRSARVCQAELLQS